jgi:hypothetical protein
LPLPQMLAGTPVMTTDDIMDWYKGPLTETRMAELRHKLAKARGLLMMFTNWETDNKDYVPTTQEVMDILKETEDP